LGLRSSRLNGCGSTSRQQRRASTSQLSAQVGHSLSRLPHRRAWFRHRAAYSYRPSFWTAHPLVGIASSSYASRENAPTVELQRLALVICRYSFIRQNDATLIGGCRR